MKLLLRNQQAPGDVLMLTAAVRDLHRAHPRKFQTAVDTACEELWENNPWNPGTRYVMSRIPFDQGAVTLTPPEARALVRQGGFQVVRTDSLFFFPRQLKWLRWMEPHLWRLPLGGQYQVLCRRVEK